MDTDFYQTTPSAYRGAILPGDTAGRLLPPPLRVEIDAARRPSSLGRRDGLEARFPSAERGASRWFRSAAEELHGIGVRESGSPAARVVFFLSGEAPDEERLVERLGAPLPEHPEGYGLAVHEDARGPRLLAGARSRRGLLRAASTAIGLLDVDREDVVAPGCRVSDAPAIDVRVLGGWALARGHRLREAIDLALFAKANRVLYNAWGWTPADRLTDEDRYLVDYARERGIEPIFELRRMSFGREYRISEPAARDRILEVFREAAAAGFRSFGFLFDDVAWESASEECDLILAAYRELGETIGRAPEFFSCPQTYWLPGQMSASWKGAADDRETREQRAYLETWGRMLPEDIHVYIANWWGDVPEGYATALRERYTELIRRRPVFFDNHLINDYRLGAVYPFALQGRPADFGEHIAGYLLNAPRPLDANAASIASALSWAWNPKAHDPERALGAAVRWRWGSASERYAGALHRWRGLASAWADGTFTATNHYRTIWRQVRSGRAGREEVGRWRREIEELGREWLAVIEAAGAEGARGDRGGGGDTDGRPPGVAAHRGLLETLASHRRLASDLALFEAFLDAREGDATARSAFERAARRTRKLALRTVADILPPLEGIEPWVEASDGSSAEGELEPGASPGRSWVEYFYRNTRREIDAVVAEMREAFGWGG